MGSLPNIFFTVAPAEWKFAWHRGVQQWRKTAETLSEGQAVITLHLHHVIGELLRELLLKQGKRFPGDTLYDAGIEEVLQWSFRWDFQSHGTIHVHVVAWAYLLHSPVASVAQSS